MGSETTDGKELFIGDPGTLPLDTRRALIQILKGPSIDGRRNPYLWQTLLRDESILQKRLGDLFLELVIDRDQQVGFTRQISTEDIDIPCMLRKIPLTFIDSVLLLHLRYMLLESSRHGERAVVSSEEMKERLIMYEKATNTDHIGFERRCSSSIIKMKNCNLLVKIRGSEDRFEISPVLGILFSGNEIESLFKAYEAIVNGPELIVDDDEESNDTEQDPEDGIIWDSLDSVQEAEK